MDSGLKTQATAAPSTRVDLLKLLIDEDVVRVLKERLGAEGIADLVMEIVNPYCPLTTEKKAKLAGGITTRAIRDREKRGQ